MAVYTLELVQKNMLLEEEDEIRGDLHVCRNFDGTGCNALFWWNAGARRMRSDTSFVTSSRRWKEHNPTHSVQYLEKVMKAACLQDWIWKSDMTRYVWGDNTVKILFP